MSKRSSDSGKKPVTLLLMTGDRNFQRIEGSVNNIQRSTADCAKGTPSKEKNSNQLRAAVRKNEGQESKKLKRLDTVDELAGTFQNPQNISQKDSASN